MAVAEYDTIVSASYIWKAYLAVSLSFAITWVLARHFVVSDSHILLIMWT